MAQSAGTVYVTVLPNMEAFATELNAGVTAAATGASTAAAAASQAGVTAGVTKSTGGLTSRFGGIGLLVGGAFAIGFARKAIGAAEAVDKQFARLGIGLNNIGLGQFQKVTEGALKGVSDRTITVQATTDQLAASLLSIGSAYFKSLGTAAPEALAKLSEGLLNVSAATGRPLQTLQRSMTQAILNTPDKAIPILQKLGVVSEQEAGKLKKMAAAGDMAGVRQAELNAVMNAFPGAAAASAGSVERLSKDMNDLQVSVGRMLLPVLDLLVKAFEAIPGPVKTFLVLGATLLVTLALMNKAYTFLAKEAIVKLIATFIKDTAVTIANTVVKVANAVATSALGVAVGGAAARIGTFTVVQQAATIATMEFNIASAGTVGAFVAVGVAGLAAGYKIGQFINKITGFSEKAINMLAGVNGAFRNLSPAEVGGTADKVSQAFQNLTDQYRSGAISLGEFKTQAAAVNEANNTSVSIAYLVARAEMSRQEATNAATEAANASSRATYNAGVVLNNFDRVVGKNVTTLADARKAWSAWKANTAQSVNFVTGSLSGLLQKGKMSLTAFTKQLETQLKNMRTFGRNINKIAKDGGAGATELVNQLIAAGPAGQAMAAQIAGASKGARQNIENLIGRSLKNAQSTAQQVGTSLIGDFGNIQAAIDLTGTSVQNLQSDLDALNGRRVTAFVDVVTRNSGSPLPPATGSGGNVPAGSGGNATAWSGKEAGGNVFAGQSYTVGERGPEVFTPDRSGIITPNGEGRGGRQPVKLVVDTGSEFTAYIEQVGAMR